MTHTIESLKAELDCGDLDAQTAFGIVSWGRDHGRAGWYRDGEYASDAEWVYGVGAMIADLEEKLDVDDTTIMDLYTEAHAEGLIEHDRALVTMVFDGHSIGYRLASGASELDADRLAEVVDDAARATFARLASAEPHGCAYVARYLDAWENACARGAGPLADADASGVHWVVSEKDFEARP